MAQQGLHPSREPPPADSVNPAVDGDQRLLPYALATRRAAGGFFGRLSDTPVFVARDNVLGNRSYIARTSA